MNRITRADLNAGRKLRKQLDRECKAVAREIFEENRAPTNLQTAVLQHLESDFARIKPRNIFSVPVIEAQPGEWAVMLVLSGLPAGVPDVIRVADKLTREEAETAAKDALIALHAAVLQMRGNEDVRYMHFYGVKLRVPGRMVDIAARKVRRGADEEAIATLRAGEIQKLQKVMGGKRLTEEWWRSQKEELHAEVMASAALLLSIGTNRLA